jgi:hypothetical protein
MKEEWSRCNYAWGKTDIVPSFSSRYASLDREPLYGNVMKKSKILWAWKNASKWCSCSVRKKHTLYSNEKCINIWKFVLLNKMIEFLMAPKSFKIYSREPVNRSFFDLQWASQSPQHYNSAIPDNTAEQSN